MVRTRKVPLLLMVCAVALLAAGCDGYSRSGQDPYASGYAGSSSQYASDQSRAAQDGPRGHIGARSPVLRDTAIYDSVNAHYGIVPGASTLGRQDASIFGTTGLDYGTNLATPFGQGVSLDPSGDPVTSAALTGGCDMGGATSIASNFSTFTGDPFLDDFGGFRDPMLDDPTWNIGATASGLGPGDITSDLPDVLGGEFAC